MRNRISRISDEAGNWISNEDDIKNLIQFHFSNLFAGNDSSDYSHLIDLIPKKVTDNMNSLLLKPISIQEVKAAVFSLGGSKAAGPDGIPGSFYQKSWDIIKLDLFRAVQSFFTSGHMLRKWNETAIVLIPKVKTPESISQFRPISLINFSYKIISKVMVNRLKPIVNEIISPEQSAFVTGRLIQDNIIVAQEVFSFLKRKRRGKAFYGALKLDMNKAYDRVNWSFLGAVLSKLGFNEHWCKLILECVSSCSMRILFNGQPLPVFYPGKGLRQGDPLSPYLFILVSECLSIMITHALLSKKFQGIKITKNAPLITHSLFADDSLFFFNGDLNHCVALNDILKNYCRASGQVINYNKSSLVFSKNTPSEFKDQVAAIFGVPITESPGKYLGLPSDWGRSKKQALTWVKDRIQSKMSGWKEKLLSQAGKDVLIKAVIQSMPVYAMSIFKFPDYFCNELNSMVANFWWKKSSSKGVHWKSWSHVSKNKKDGGLGFRDFRLLNSALLAKQTWRLLSYPDSLCARVLKGIYFPTVRKPFFNPSGFLNS